MNLTYFIPENINWHCFSSKHSFTVMFYATVKCRAVYQVFRNGSRRGGGAGGRDTTLPSKSIYSVFCIVTTLPVLLSDSVECVLPYPDRRIFLWVPQSGQRL